MLNLPHLEVPLVSTPDGSVLVRDTQVQLEHIVADFEDGASAEEIVSRHGELRLTDVFLVLSFYLKKRRDVERYLLERQRPESARVRPKPAA